MSETALANECSLVLQRVREILEIPTGYSVTECAERVMLRLREAQTSLRELREQMGAPTPNSVELNQLRSMLEPFGKDPVSALASLLAKNELPKDKNAAAAVARLQAAIEVIRSRDTAEGRAIEELVQAAMLP